MLDCNSFFVQNQWFPTSVLRFHLGGAHSSCQEERQVQGDFHEIDGVSKVKSHRIGIPLLYLKCLLLYTQSVWKSLARFPACRQAVAFSLLFFPVRLFHMQQEVQIPALLSGAFLPLYVYCLLQEDEWRLILSVVYYVIIIT